MAKLQQLTAKAKLHYPYVLLCLVTLATAVSLASLFASSNPRKGDSLGLVVNASQKAELVSLSAVILIDASSYGGFVDIAYRAAAGEIES